MNLLIPILVNVSLMCLIVLLGKIKTKGVTVQLKFNVFHLIMGLALIFVITLLVSFIPAFKRAYELSHNDFDKQVFIVLTMLVLIIITIYLKIYFRRKQ